MSHYSKPTNLPHILGQVASLVILLATALYFVGWIYRWAYFAFFQLELTTLDLPVESFFMVPLQVFFASDEAIWKTGRAILGLVLFVVAYQLLRVVLILLLNWGRSRFIRHMKSRNWSPRTRQLLSFPELNPANFPPFLLNELVVVLLILFFLFQLAYTQGNLDARRDAVNSTSTMPVVTLVIPEKNLALGRKLNDLTDNPSLKGFRIIGDKGRFKDLWGGETTDTTDPDNLRVWRLLLDRNGQFYLFQALSANSPPGDRPLVLVIQESNVGDQLLILSPEATQMRRP